MSYLEVWLDDIVLSGPSTTQYQLQYEIATGNPTIYNSLKYTVYSTKSIQKQAGYSILHKTTKSLQYAIIRVATRQVYAPIDTFTFLATTTHEFFRELSVSYLVVGAGGGSGNGVLSGAGGGGAVKQGTATITAGVKTITIGDGGPADTKGSDTVFDTITAEGGGKGGTYGGTGPSSGGSGGGGQGYPGSTAGAAATDPAYGHNGGAGHASVHGGGGGGAGGEPNTDGYGGDGVQATIDLAYYGPGGGGGNSSGGQSGGWEGGGHGGGNGTAGTAGAVNKGAGAGGNGTSYGGNGKAGGSGIVKLKYAPNIRAKYSIWSTHSISKNLEYVVRPVYFVTYRVKTTHIINDGELKPTIHSASHDDVYAPWNGRTSHIEDIFDRTTNADFTGKYYLVAHDTTPAISSPWWAIFDYSAPIVLTSYRMLVYRDMAPATWTFAGSNNATDWLTLHTVSATTWTGAEVQDRTYTFVSATPYQYYKWNITGMVEATHFCIFKLYTYPESIKLTYVVVPDTHQLFWLQYYIKHPVPTVVPLEYWVWGHSALSKSLEYVILKYHTTLKYSIRHSWLSQRAKIVYYVRKMIPSCDIVTGYAPLNVRFVGDYTEYTKPTLWHWEFGDGGESSEQNPIHQYVSPGTYTVTLDGASDELTIAVLEPEPIVVEFFANPYTGVFPLRVQFENLTYDPFEDIVWDWDFGDGSPHSSEKNPIHIYTVENNYNVTLTATRP